MITSIIKPLSPERKISVAVMVVMNIEQSGWVIMVTMFKHDIPNENY